MDQGIREQIYRDVERTASYGWNRPIWRIFMEEPWLADLTDEQYRRYAEDVMERVSYIQWDNYLVTNAGVEGGIRLFLVRYDVPKELWDESIWRVKNKFFLSRINKFKRIAARENYQGDRIMPGEKDLDNCELARIFAFLPRQKDVEKYLEPLNVTYRYDQLHMITWFSCQITLGSGNYSRSCPNYSARKTYGRLLNPWSLLWIAAALGEDPEVVKAAAREMEDYRSYSAKCGVVRRAIPFDRIYELALKTRGMEIRETGYEKGE